MIKVVNGDILKAKEDIICHQVNCQGVMMSGLAKQVKEMYPNVYNSYKSFCSQTKPINLLGQVLFIDVKDHTIANLFGQENYGVTKRHTDYRALRAALAGVAFRSCIGYSVAIPYNIGCGLGGGDWDIVYDIIKDVFRYLTVTIYKLEGGS